MGRKRRHFTAQFHPQHVLLCLLGLNRTKELRQPLFVWAPLANGIVMDGLADLLGRGGEDGPFLKVKVYIVFLEFQTEIAV